MLDDTCINRKIRGDSKIGFAMGTGMIMRFITFKGMFPAFIGRAGV